MLPKELYKFFWEHNAAEFNEDTYWYFTIERLLEHGNDPAIRWLMGHYPQEKIIEVVKSSRAISKKTANFWKNFFHLREEEVYCLRKSSQNPDKIFWPN